MRRPQRRLPPATPPPESEATLLGEGAAAWPAVVLRGLVKRFGAKVAVDGLSLDVPGG